MKFRPFNDKFHSRRVNMTKDICVDGFVYPLLFISKQHLSPPVREMCLFFKPLHTFYNGQKTNIHVHILPTHRHLLLTNTHKHNSNTYNFIVKIFKEYLQSYICICSTENECFNPERIVNTFKKLFIYKYFRKFPRKYMNVSDSTAFICKGYVFNRESVP